MDNPFKFYINKDGFTTVQALQVSLENLYDLPKYIIGQAGGDERFRFSSADRQWVAEVGDYIVTDLSGACIVVDKEMFESYYQPMNEE